MIIFLFILVSLPMLAAIGHDFYLLYENPDKGFEFSALGFLWTKYHPESYRTAIEQIDPELWNTINYFLTYKAFYIGLGFALTFYVIIGLSAFMKKSKEKANNARAAAEKWRAKK